MFEKSLIALLAADTELQGLLPQFSGVISIFSGMAPQKAERPYVVLDIDRVRDDNLAAGAFSINFDIYDRQESGVSMRNIAERIEFVCDRAVIKNDERFDSIRLYFEDGREVENSDIKIRHYVITVTARAGRKKWMGQIARENQWFTGAEPLYAGSQPIIYAPQIQSGVFEQWFAGSNGLYADGEMIVKEV